MHIEAHAGAGWLLAELSRGDRRLRAWIMWAALLPDLDGLAWFGGFPCYLAYHHRLTHTLCFSLLVTVLAVISCSSHRLKALVFTQLAFYTHYFGDYLFTRYPLYWLWPISNREFFWDKALSLGHPVNQYLLWASAAIMLILSIYYKRTPLEAISVRLDRFVVGSFGNVFASLIRKKDS